MKKKKLPDLSKSAKLLQSQADSITTTTIFPPIKPLTTVKTPRKRRQSNNYAIFIDCFMAISLATGLISIGIFIGLNIK